MSRCLGGRLFSDSPNDSGFGEKVIIFSTNISSLVRVDNKKKDILILGKCPKIKLLQRKNALYWGE